MNLPLPHPYDDDEMEGVEAGGEGAEETRREGLEETGRGGGVEAGGEGV